MPTQWKVTYALNRVDVNNQVPTYPDLGVSVRYEDDKIVAVEHTLDTDDSMTDMQAITRSQQNLKLFWELLQYKRGVPIPISSRTAERVTATPGATGTRTGLASASISAALARGIGMPDPVVFTQAPSRLIVWLRLANDAHAAPVDADAIRNYYMIWEDKNGIAKDSDVNLDAVNLRLVRNFVSHGFKLDDLEIRKLVESEVRISDIHYDPTDSAQQRFVQKYRQIGRMLIERELAPLV